MGPYVRAIIQQFYFHKYAHIHQLTYLRMIVAALIHPN